MLRALTLAAVVAAGLPAAGTAAPPTAAPFEAVKLSRCSLADHEAAFQGRMRSIEGSQRMGMRFTLLERTAPGRFHSREAPGLGVWRKSKPGVSSFGYEQGVRKLAENAVYRMQVDFRWYSDGGEVIGRARRRSAPCRQFDSLPNLRVRLVEAHSTRVTGVVRYDVRVVNAGQASASAVPVGLSVDGDVVDTQTIAVLDPGGSRLLSFRGPKCERSVEARVDPDEASVESAEHDNAHELRCEKLPRG